MKAPPKFKAGQKVVVVNWNVIGANRDLAIGESFVIREASDATNLYSNYTQVCFPQEGRGFFNTELELEHVFNSPLNQELK